MKKLCTLLGLFMVFTLTAQDTYFTVYNFSVAAEDVSSVYDLVDGYYSKNKPDGVTVSLYENHFNDKGYNFTHSIVFSGTLDAMGGMYAGGDNDTWQLFITRINIHMEEGFSSLMGRRLDGYGDSSTQHPVQKYFLLDAADTDAFDTGYAKYHSKHNPEGAIVAMGNITAGRSPHGENRWVIQGFKDFKSAMGGTNMLRTEKEKAASDKAWQAYMDSHGGVEVVRSGLRVQLGQW